MRILHLDAGREMRGGQWQALRLMCGLRERGHDGMLLAHAESPLFKQGHLQGLEVGELSLRTVARESRVADVTHAHDARSHAIAALAGRKPVIVSRRVAFPVHRNPLSRWKYGRAAHYIAVSEFVRNALLEGGIAPSGVTVVYDGVPTQPLSSGGEIMVLESDDPGKGTALAVQAAKLAGFPARLSRNLAKDLERAAVFVYITSSEGLGSAALLAMAAGVPVIASKVGGLPEIIEHERTGLLTLNQPEPIAAAISRLMQDRDLARSLGLRARAVAQEKFSVSRMVAGTLGVYEACS